MVGLLSLGTPALALAAEGEGEGGEDETASPPSEPAETPPEEGSEGSALVKKTNKRHWGVGARLRYVFVPKAMLNLFLAHSTSMNSVGFGAEVVGRKGDSDIVFGIEYDGASPENGLYQDKGDDPGQCQADSGKCPDFTEFDGLGMIGLDVTFIWHAQLSSRVQLRYGGGAGVGIVTGAVYQTKKFCPPGTTNDSLDDPNKCATTLPGETRKKSDSVPPVVPIISALIGARFLISDNLSLNAEFGFRDVLYLGMSTDWIF